VSTYGVAQPGSLDAPSSPAASSRDPVLGLLLKWTALPLQARVGSKLRIAACADAATDERVRALLDLGHGSGAITLVNKGCKRCVDLAARSSPTIAPRQSWRQYSAETTSG
jgi:hypothetical protein